MSKANLTNTPRPLDCKLMDAALTKAAEANQERDKCKRDALTLEALQLYRKACEADDGLSEIERLQEAKRRALAIADERSRENVGLRAENERLRAALAEARA